MWHFWTWTTRGCPHKLQAQVELLDRNPRAALAYCHYVLADQDMNPFPRQDNPRPVSSDPLKQMIQGCFIHSPSTVMIRRDATA